MTRDVSVALRGYRIAARARATRFRWITGDGASYTSAGCGREPDAQGDGSEAAVQHVYETKGRYVLRLEVDWIGSYTFSGRGRSGGGNLGGVSVLSTRPYTVIEVISVLTD